MSNVEPLLDHVDEALRIVRAADERKLLIRIMGAVAFRIHCPKFGYLQKIFERKFTDIDLVVSEKQESSNELMKLFDYLGYHARTGGVGLHWQGRQVFIDDANGRSVDIFSSKWKMCHAINFRLEADYPTVPLAELLLQKSQIIELNYKDVKDVTMLLLEHDIGNDDEEKINIEYIAKLLSDDWGFWYTATTNLEKIATILSNDGFSWKNDAEAKADVSTKIKRLLEFIEREPKSIGWKIRAKIGTKKKWYNTVGSYSS